MAADHVITLFYLLALLCYPAAGAGRNNKGFFLKPEAFSSSQVAATEETLRHLMRVQCLPNLVSVSFSQEEMLALGILPAQISFISARCQFRSNATHYHAQTTGTGCNSTLSVDSALNKQVLSNAVVLVPPPHSSMDSQVISIDDDEDSADAFSSGSGDESSDDSHSITIPFSCDLTPQSNGLNSLLSLESKHKVGAAPDLHGNLSYDMILFDNEELIEPLTEGHAILVDSNIYVKIKPKVSSEANRFFLQNCYYVSGDDRVGGDNSYLIRNGCPLEPSVSFLDNKQEGDKLFSFKVHRLHKQPTFLRCDLQPCTTNVSQRKDIPLCVSQMFYCASKSMSSKKQMSVTWPYPLVVIEKTTPRLPDCQEQLLQTSCHCEESSAIASDLKAGGVVELKLWVVILICIAAFSTGCFSVMSLWCIHNCTRTDHKKTAKPKCDAKAKDCEPTAQCRLMKEDAHNAPQAS